MSGDSIASVLKDLWRRYHEDTPQRLKLIDAYLAYVMMTGIVQFVYCCLVGTFPFNSFLSGFISTVGCFVLGGASKKLWSRLLNYCFFPVCLRIQTNPQNRSQFKTMSPERAFADFVFAHVVLHLVVINFIG